MDKLFNEYLSNLIHKSTDRLLPNHCVIKTISSIDISKLIDYSLFNDDSYELITFSFNKYVLYNPYEPFLDWIVRKLDINKINIDEFFIEMSIPDILKPVFFNYITEGCAMHEECLWECVEYEKEEIIKIIISMLDYFSKIKPVIFVVNNIESAPFSTLSLMHKLIKTYSDIHILAFYNTALEISEYKNNIFNELINTANIYGIVVDYEFIDDNSIQDSADFSLEDLDNYFNILNNNLEFRELEDSIYQQQFLLDNIDKNDLNTTTEFELYELCAYSYTLSKKHYNTLQVCESIKDNCNKDFSNHKMFIYKYYKGRTQLILGDKNASKDSLEKALEYASVEKNDYHIMLAKFLLTLVKYYDCLHDYSDKREIDEDLINLMQKYKYFNHIAILLCICSENDTSYYESADSIETNVTRYNHAVSILKEHYNPRMLCSVYRFFIVRTSKYNNTACLYFYNKYIDILKKGSLEEIYAKLGIGYIHTLDEKYEDAHNNYVYALECCYNKSDILHLTESLYNIANNAFVSCNYTYSYKYSSLCLWIVDTMNYPYLFASSFIKLHAIKAISSFKLGNYYICNLEQSIITKLVNNSLDPISTEDLFFHHLVNSYVFYHNNEYNKHEEQINICKTFLSKLSYNLSQLYSKFVSLNDDSANKFNNSLNNTSVENIVNLVNISKDKIKLNLQKKDTIFSHKWYKVLSSHTSVNEIINNTFSLFLKEYNLDDITLLIKNNNEFRQFSYGNNIIDNKDLLNIFDFININKKEFITNYLSLNYSKYNDFIKYFGFSKVYGVLAIPFFEDNDIKFIAISCKKSPEKNISLLSEYTPISSYNLNLFKTLFLQLVDEINKLSN